MAQKYTIKKERRTLREADVVTDIMGLMRRGRECHKERRRSAKEFVKLKNRLCLTLFFFC